MLLETVPEMNSIPGTAVSTQLSGILTTFPGITLVVHLNFELRKPPTETGILLKFLDAQFPFLYIHLTPKWVIIHSRPETGRPNFTPQRSAT